MPRLLLALTAALVLLAGCGDDKTEKEAKPTATPTAAAARTGPGGISTDLQSEPSVPEQTGKPPTKLVTRDVVKGTGAPAKAGDVVSVQYTGVSFKDGKKFDASWDRGAQPFQFQLGAGMVIPGWDKGVAGMRAGGRRELVIPPRLAYGAQGSPPAIGPDETLVFVVDLVQIG